MRRSRKAMMAQEAEDRRVLENEFRNIAPTLEEKAPITFAAMVDTCLMMNNPSAPNHTVPGMMEKLIKLETDLVYLGQLRNA